jgi:ribosomal protein S18 acetylase RimI-like enzyme
MILRKVQDEDISGLSEFAARTFYQAYGWYNTEENMKNYVEKYFSKENLCKEIREPETEIYILTEDEKIKGYVKSGRQNNLEILKDYSHMEIERIYVDNSDQRNGFGKTMLDFIIQKAKEKNSQFLWLGVWQKNEKAIAFYSKNGFKIIGTTTFILGDDDQDDFIMARELI